MIPTLESFFIYFYGMHSSQSGNWHIVHFFSNVINQQFEPNLHTHKKMSYLLL
jgi:hypothetical protein